MNEKICLFAGTTEGRELAEYICGRIPLVVCVATEYGAVLLDGLEGLDVRAGRMDENQMSGFFSSNDFTLIIDATHPYAGAATENIRAASEKCGVRLIRVLREGDLSVSGAVYVSTVGEARDYLLGKDGNIFLTTGSKELASYAGLDMSRVWARVLPMISSLEACFDAGIEVSHIVAAQGPFSEELNAAQFRSVSAKYIVTKDSGKNGGFDEKIAAAKEVGAVPVIIGRPRENVGVSFKAALDILDALTGRPREKVYIIGAGVGSRSQLTSEAKRILHDCGAVIGAKRVTDSVADFGKPVYNAVAPDKIRDTIRGIIDSEPECTVFAAVMSGDVSFYSGAKKLRETLSEAGFCVTLVPGISSVSYFAAKLGVSLEDALTVSLHGRTYNIARAVASHRFVMALTGGLNGVGTICQRLSEYGLADVEVTVGERLSYPDEKITVGRATELSEEVFDPLSVMLISNPAYSDKLRHGIPDCEFQRGDVPMTKSEVRGVVLSKLELSPDSVVYDIGSGTGSVSVECAFAAYNGAVYALEKNPEALALTKINARKFSCDNIIEVEGEAPDSQKELPAPTHAFIGGSSGNLREIIDALTAKNPAVRIVITAVTLETQAEALQCVKRFAKTEISEVGVSCAKKLGRYNLMNAQNPVTIFTMTEANDG